MPTQCSFRAMQDFFAEIDLNPAAGAVLAPLDARAMHYFGFTSGSQQLVLLDPLPQGSRVLFSWHMANAPGIGPVAATVQAHGVLEMLGPNSQTARYEASHDRAHVLLWIDGAAPPPAQQVRVRISAWSK